MLTNVDDLIAQLDPARRLRIEARAAEMLAEEQARRAVRRERKRAKTNMATALTLTVAAVSPVEKQSHLRVSTFQKNIAATGGRLSVVAEFPNRPNIIPFDEPESVGPGRKLVKKAIALTRTAGQG